MRYFRNTFLSNEIWCIGLTPRVIRPICNLSVVARNRWNLCTYYVHMYLCLKIKKETFKRIQEYWENRKCIYTIAVLIQKQYWTRRCYVCRQAFHSLSFFTLLDYMAGLRSFQALYVRFGFHFKKWWSNTRRIDRKCQKYTPFNPPSWRITVPFFIFQKHFIQST